MLGGGAFLTLILSGLGQDAAFSAHMGIIAIVLGIATITLMRRPAPSRRRGGDGQCRRPRLFRRADQVRLDPHRVLGLRRLPRRRGDRAAARLAGAQFRAVVQFRPDAAAAHFGRGLRLWRHRADDHQLLRGAAHLPRRADQQEPRLVRVLGLPAVHRHGGDRLPARHHPEPRICRARMVHRPVADRRLGRLPDPVPGHDHQAQGAAYLCGQLVLPCLHRHHRAAARRQQPERAGEPARFEELLAVLGRAGCADPVVVRPQRGGLLPHRRVPGHDVLLHAQAGRAPGLQLPAVDHPLLGPDLPLHLGRPAPPALHRPARLGADARHGVLDHAVDAQLGRHDQRPDDPARRLGQGPHRPHHPHDGDRHRLLRHVDLRRSGDVDQVGERAQPLYRLDHRPRALGCARLGRHDLVRGRLLHGAAPVGAQAALLAAHGQLALLARDHRHRRLRRGHVGLGHHAGPDVARVR